jgi:hypothetical protein
MSGTKVVRTEKRVRGPFGQVIKWAFILFNILMLVWMISGMGAVSSVVTGASSEAEKAGAAIGGTIGFSFILFIWCFGDVILGLFVMLTRGKKVITEETVT